jgi:hypothetical protein
LTRIAGAVHFATARDSIDRTTTMDARALLIEAGQALYGPRWQRETARLLNVLDVRVRDWQAGRRQVPDEIWPRLHGALRQKRQAVAAAQKKVARAC